MPCPTRIRQRKTTDGDYELADHSHKIGTITAYCKRVARDKCPDTVNET